MSTSLNPWETRCEDLAWMRDTLRQVLLASLGELADPPLSHTFVSVSGLGQDGDLCCHYITGQGQGQRYHAILRIVIKGTKNRDVLSKVGNSAILITVNDHLALPALVNKGGQAVTVTITSGEDLVVVTAPATVTEVIYFRSLSDTSPSASSPRYWLYGRGESVYLSVMETEQAADQLVARLEQSPAGVAGQLVARGLGVSVPEVLPGQRLQPGLNYRISYVGLEAKESQGSIRLSRESLWEQSKPHLPNSSPLQPHQQCTISQALLTRGF